MKPPISALVLAAGFGTRLKPLTNTLPKPLVPVAGVPMILYNLALLKKHGIRDVVINLHYLGNKIRAYLGDGKKIGLKIRYSTEPEILGTGGGIRKVLNHFKDDFLVINGDIILNANLSRLIREHRKHRPLATLTLRQSRDQKYFGLLHFRKRRITSILSKPLPHSSDESAHFTGLHILERAPLLKLKRNHKLCIVQDYYIPQLLAGNPLNAMLIDSYWNDCGTIQALNKTTNDINKCKVRLPHTAEARRMARILGMPG